MLFLRRDVRGLEGDVPGVRGVFDDVPTRNTSVSPSVEDEPVGTGVVTGSSSSSIRSDEEVSAMRGGVSEGWRSVAW